MTPRKRILYRSQIQLRANELERLQDLHEESQMSITHIMRAAFNFMCAQDDPISIINNMRLTPMAVPGRPRKRESNADFK